MAWTQWGQLYDLSAATMTLERVYTTSPRVRAKLLVATQISMNEFLAGEVILRQQLSEITGTSVARVQLEGLQTSALRESDRGAYLAAFGVSALPDPPTDRDGADHASLSLSTAIEQERERIIHRLRYGAIVRGQNVTIASLTLFGTAMALVDVVLDGETFYPMDLKPWIATKIAVVPAVYSNTSLAAASSSTSDDQELYAPSHDAFQSLRLRFLLAKTLLPLRLSTSDILIRETTHAPLEAYYRGASSVVDIEVHVEDESFRVAVDGYLRNSSLAEEFSAMEPQWMIAAIDIDSRSGILYTPSSSTSSTSATSDATTTTAATGASSQSESALDVAFELANVPFGHVASRKWCILERIAEFLGFNGCSSCHVRFKDIVPLQSSLDGGNATHNDGDAVDDGAELDPINAASTALSVRIESQSANLSALIQNLQQQMSRGASATLCTSIGVTESDDDELFGPGLSSSATCALASCQNASASASPPSAMQTAEPFVLLNLTLMLSNAALDASSTTAQVAASVFEQFRVRSALLVLLQQLAVYDEHVMLLNTTAERFSSDSAAAQSSEPLLSLQYKVTIHDESQRRGIVTLFLSRRLERTISEYTNQRLLVVGRIADLHADGSPWLLGEKLPGIAVSSESRTVPAAAAALSSGSSAIASSAGDRLYRFHNPADGANPTVLQFPDPSIAPKCPSTASTSPPSSMQCISIQFVSEFDTNSLFLRQIESNVDLLSPSLVLPQGFQSAATATAATATAATAAAIPAPRIYNESSSGGGGSAAPAPWIFYANTSSLQPGATTSNSTVNSSSASTVTTTAVLRFHLEFTPDSNDGNLSSIPSTFRLDVRVELGSSSGSGSRSISVRKSSFLPLVAATNASSVSGHSYLNPFVSAQLGQTASAVTQPTPAGSNSSDAAAVAFRISENSIGGFFNRTRVSSDDNSPSCGICAAKLRACDALLECRALSACFGAHANADPALYTSLLLLHSANSSATTAGDPSRSLVLKYSPMEQTLTFARADFVTTLEFLIDIDNDDSGGRTQVFPDLTREDTSLAALGEVLMALYRGQQQNSNSSSDFPFVQVLRGENSTSAVNGSDAIVRIQYFFLSAWTSSSVSSSNNSPLPYVQTVLGDSPIVTTASSSERLELVVLSS